MNVKEQQRTTWDSISAGWLAAMPVFERGAAAVTAELVRLAGIGPGDRVLDAGTGLGEPARTAAGVVGPAGRVVGVDLSAAMLDAARRRLGRLSNVELVVADLEAVPLPSGSFDAALSRWGLMFAVDHAAAFGELRRLLRPGGTLAAATWAGPAEVPMIAAGYAALNERLRFPAPPPGTPGPWSMSDPAALMEELDRAGFVDVSVAPFPVPFRVADPDEYAAFTRSVTPPAVLDMIRERYGAADHAETWADVGAAVADHRDADGLDLTSTALCLRATAP
ncbi:class I SAM-dependent methyltransferase [Dactylosporangium sp. CA-139066]|uniref:class I SAM-dependent methyltransferase n=1 Tax=Dactylosporangium sp. CA-139066 TaxID=3239930 RepID=UPI003D90D55A